MKHALSLSACLEMFEITIRRGEEISSYLASPGIQYDDEVMIDAERNSFELCVCLQGTALVVDGSSCFAVGPEASLIVHGKAQGDLTLFSTFLTSGVRVDPLSEQLCRVYEHTFAWEGDVLYLRIKQEEIDLERFGSIRL